MSLFKTREWWSATGDGEELHTTGSLLVAALGDDRYDKIMVGSLSGLVRLYSPKPSSYSPDHLILEKQLSHPVVQLEFGLLLPGVKELLIAVLHPRAISVYKLTSKDDQPVLSLVHSHPLSHTAHSMVVGSFGRATDQEMVCILSMDGQLCIVDHTGIIVTCYLPNFILPGPLAYTAHTDCLVTVSSARQLEVYRYQSVCMASTVMENDGKSSGSGRKLMPDWTVILSDAALDVKCFSVEEGPSLFLVLGEHSVMCIRDNGTFLFSHRLDCSPSCILPYSCTIDDSGDPRLQYLLMTHTQQVMVMNNHMLVWSASVPHTPVDVRLGTFKELQGVLVTVSEVGMCMCSYLGTDPTALSPVLPVSPHYDVQASKTELNRLQAVIEATSDAIVKDEPEMVIEVVSTGDPRHMKAPSEMEEEEEEGEVKQKCVDIKLSLRCKPTGKQLCDVTVYVTVDSPLSAHLSTRSFSAVDSIPVETCLTLVCSSSLLLANRDVTIMSLYSTAEGLQRSIQFTVTPPLGLFCDPCLPVKESQFKITMETNHPILAPSTLYPDLILPSTPPNAIGFQSMAGPTVTIVASKYSNRYRVQSNSFSALFMFTEDLLQRLTDHHVGKSPKLEANFTESLPLREYFELVEHHYKVRAMLAQCREMMGRHSQQFRAIQKRLLARFKDKTPISLSNLDTLLNGSSQQLLALTEKTDELEGECLVAGRELSCGTNLIRLLLKIKAKLSDDQLAALSPYMDISLEQGWEEVTDAAVTQMLSTTLAKSHKDRSVTLPELQLPADCQKLKRHIALFCDRLQKVSPQTTTQPLKPSTIGAAQDHPHPPRGGGLPTLDEETDL